MKEPDILKLMSAITMTSTTYSRNSSAFERKNSTEFGKQEWIPENGEHMLISRVFLVVLQ